MTTVRPATKSDVPELSSTLARAFFDDPVMTWMLPEDKTRAHRLPWLFAALTKYYLAPGACEVVVTDRGKIGGAALWAGPGEWQQGFWAELRMMPTIVRTFATRLRVAANVPGTMKKAHPAEPHWYLSTIGTDPEVRGSGLGHQLMRSRLDRVDAEGAPAYLESSKADNVPYYQRFGFEVTREIVIPDGGPTLWAMWRSPR